MSQTADGAAPSRAAWQPFTFGGVAAFARSGVVRVLVAELLTAILTACSVVYYVHHGWSPAILQTVRQMPATARISGGKLAGIDDTIVGETKFFAVAVTPRQSEQIGQSADVQVQFRRDNLRVGTAFRPDWGWQFEYGTGADMYLGRPVLEPWWGAWQPVLLTGIGVAVFVMLFIIWAGVAAIYTIPAKCLAWFADRELSWGGAFRLSSAALVAATFVILAGLLLYIWQAIDLIELAFFYAAHLVTGCVYLIGGTLACPRPVAEEPKPNPFGT